MGYAATPRLTSKDVDLTRNVNILKAVIDPVLRNPIVSGVVIEGLEVTNGDTFYVNHGLGRVPVGYILVATTAACTLYTDTSAAVRPTAQLALVPSADATISVLVF